MQCPVEPEEALELEEAVEPELLAALVDETAAALRAWLAGLPPPPPTVRVARAVVAAVVAAGVACWAAIA